MKVSKRCHYALRALVDLGIAQVLGRPLVRIGDLAQKENLPLNFLEQIFIQLRQAGYLESKRGSQGGYMLAMPASEIRFGEIIRLLDGGSLAPVDCVSRSQYGRCSCPDESHCGVHALMSEVHRAVTGILDRVTLADTVRSTLRKIRRNKAAVPFVKMVMRRMPRKRTPVATPAPRRTAAKKKTAKTKPARAPAKASKAGRKKSKKL